MYIPPSADAASACELLLTVEPQLQTTNSQALLFISGDFNHAPLSSTLPTFTQYVNCHTRDDRILDCFDSTDWEVLYSPHGEDVDSMTTCVTDYINFCVNNTVPVKRVRCFPNNKPWVTPDLKNLLNPKKKGLLHLGIKS